MYLQKKKNNIVEFDNNKTKATTKIQVEVDYGVFEEREIPIEDHTFLAVTDEAFKLMTMFNNSGKLCFCVYCALLKHRNRITNMCFPSIQTLAKETKTSERRIKETINSLEQEKYLLINSGGRNKSNNYYFPKEWFFKYFKDDIRQANAKRRHDTNVLKSDSKSNRTKKQLVAENNAKTERIRELEKENKRLREEQSKPVRINKSIYYPQQQQSNGYPPIESFDDEEEIRPQEIMYEYEEDEEDDDEW